MNIRTVIDGMANLAIESNSCQLQVKPKYYVNKEGEKIPVETKWLIKANKLDSELKIKDFFAGIMMDGDTYDISIYVKDNEKNDGDYLPFASRKVSSAKKSVKDGKSAFQRMFSIIETAYPSLTDEVLNYLTDVNYTKSQTGIIYPILIEIDKDSAEDLISHFKSHCYFSNLNRYWRKMLIIGNRKFWLVNHVFHPQIDKFRKMINNLTGLSLDKDEYDQVAVQDNSSIETLLNDSFGLDLFSSPIKEKGIREGDIDQTISLKNILDGINSLVFSLDDEDPTVTVDIKPIFDSFDNVEETRWLISTSSPVDIGLNITKSSPYPFMIFDNSGSFPRLIAQRRLTNMKKVISNPNKRSKSAFQRCFRLIEEAYDKIDNNVIEKLMDFDLIKSKTKIVYPFLKEIDPKIAESDDDERINDDFRKQCLYNDMFRYWRNILVLNDRYFWITNHIFHYSYIDFKELLEEWTDMELSADEWEEEDRIKRDNKQRALEEKEKLKEENRQKWLMQKNNINN